MAVLKKLVKKTAATKTTTRASKKKAAPKKGSSPLGLGPAIKVLGPVQPPQWLLEAISLLNENLGLTNEELEARLEVAIPRGELQKYDDVLQDARRRPVVSQESKPEPVRVQGPAYPGQRFYAY